jgi:small subunit ribosomal protein S2
MGEDGTMDTLSKREKLQISRQRAKLEKNLGSIADLTRLPAALFVVDILKEHIAVAEAKRLGIPVIAMVDTNSDPRQVDFAIPANDDASKSITKILDVITTAIAEGIAERKSDKSKGADSDEEQEEVVEEVKPGRKRILAVQDVEEAVVPETAPETAPEAAPDSEEEAAAE